LLNLNLVDEDFVLILVGVNKLVLVIPSHSHCQAVLVVSHDFGYFGVLLELLFKDVIRYAVVNCDLFGQLHEPLISHVSFL
jgi:hypothetical protein